MASPVSMVTKAIVLTNGC